MSNATEIQKVFITGGTGLVGSYLARLLVQRGWEVMLLARPGADRTLLAEAADQVSYIEGTLEDQDALEEGVSRAPVVVHAAGLVTFDPRRRDRLRKVNQEGTRRIVDVALEGGTAHFLHVSSIAAIGRMPDAGVITEHTPWQENPLNSIYARSKFAAEREVWRGHAEGLPVSIVNPAIVFGAGHWDRSSMKLLTRIYRGLPFLPSGSASFVDVRDLARVMALLLERGPTNERLINAPHNLKWSDVIPQMTQLMGRRAPTRELPPVLAAAAPMVMRLRSLATGQEQEITRETLRISKAEFVFRSVNDHLIPGFQYRPFEETLRDTVAAFMDSYPKGRSAATLDI